MTTTIIILRTTMIEVVTPSCPPGQAWKFDSVTKWHVDESGALHLQYPDRGGNAASFSPGAWLSVVDVSTDPTAEASRSAVGSISAVPSKRTGA